MARIVITEFMDEGAVDLLRAGHDVDYRPDLVDRSSEMSAAVAGADGLIVRNRTLVSEDLLASAPRLRVVGRLGVGLDNIDLDACADHGVVVHPATGANAVAVAEYVIGALLVLVRGVYQTTAPILEGAWPRQESTGQELAGRTLGLVGYGTIAREVAHRAAALGMSILAHDPFLPERFAWQPARPVELSELLSESEAVSIHVPLVSATHHLIDTAALATMRPGSVLVNTSRGGIVDEAALVESMRAGRIAGAALDVFETEPPSPDRLQEFASASNLLLTPHIAGITAESNVRVSRVVAEAVLEELSDG